MHSYSQYYRLIAAIGLMSCFYGHGAGGKENNLRPRPLVREDSRWAIDVNAQRRYIVNSKNYKRSSRIPRTPRPISAQNIDGRASVQFSDTEVRPHLRSCSCCQPPIPIEGVPDPWYVRWFSCCRSRRK